jgi:hypothetical protein
VETAGKLSGCAGLLDLLATVILRDRSRAGGRNVDTPRLQRFRNLALQLNSEQAVLQIGRGDLHVVSEIKGLLESSCSDTPVKDLNALWVGVLLAGHEQHVFFLDEFDLVRREACDRQAAR